MKKIYYGYLIAAMLLVQSCQKTEELSDKDFKPKTQSGLRPEGGRLFYYAGDEKIPLTEDSTAVIFLDSDSSKMLSSLRTKGIGPAVTRLNSGYFLVEKKSKSVITALSGKAIAQNVFKSMTGKRVVPTGEIAVKLKPGVTIDQIIKESAGKLKLVKAKKRGWYLLRLDGQASLLDIANGLQESGKVKYSYPNFLATVRKSSSDPLFSSQYYLLNNGSGGGVAGIDINLGTTPYGINTNIKVAVIDDGVEAHEDLAGRVLQGFTPGYPTEYGAPFGIVDVYGDPIGHGQACAGIIAATRDNNIGIAGIAPLAKIIPVNIFKPGVSEQDIADAINWAWDEGGADVLSNSWGIYDNPGPMIAIEEAIDDALTLGRGGKGSIVVFSSGNDNLPATICPSYRPGVIAVGAVNRQ
ncbi:MAG TPA: S8 family serine peptidase, partial [Pedobacter sp.]|uniref:S8 family serine peptidase n=1 Tax=Pedobacter sp. TaxID=1411316 RepID=UPI002C55C9E1